MEPDHGWDQRPHGAHRTDLRAAGSLFHLFHAALLSIKSCSETSHKFTVSGAPRPSNRRTAPLLIHDEFFILTGAFVPRQEQLTSFTFRESLAHLAIKHGENKSKKSRTTKYFSRGCSTRLLPSHTLDFLFKGTFAHLLG